MTSPRATWGRTQDAGILGITLKQPWAHVVVHHGKRIENRPWAPPKWAIGKRLAIHAGKAYDDEGAVYVAGEGVVVPIGDLVRGAIIGTALLAGFVACDLGRSHDLTRPIPAGQERWAFGPYSWFLEDVRAIADPIPCKGALGLWRLPVDAEAALAR